MIYIIMGVSGSGKSTVGKLLSDHTGWAFYEGDDFHPPENINQMSQGIPLTDQDRLPWLKKLQALIDQNIASNKNVILSCSALKSSYRKILQGNHQKIVWIYLRGDYELVQARITRRQDHFLPANLLSSQFASLEEPETAISIDIAQSLAKIVETILGEIEYQN